MLELLRPSFKAGRTFSRLSGAVNFFSRRVCAATRLEGEKFATLFEVERRRVTVSRYGNYFELCPALSDLQRRILLCGVKVNAKYKFHNKMGLCWCTGIKKRDVETPRHH